MSTLAQAFNGQNVLVVGGTKGIGKAIVNGLWRYGAKVTYSGRTVPTLGIEKFLSNPPIYVPSDLSTVRGCLSFSERRISQARDFDTVVFCQGTTSKKHLELNSEGIEQDFATSYLSRFVLLHSFMKRPQTKLKRVYIFGFPGVEYQPLKNMADLNFTETKYSQYNAHYNTIVCNEALVYEAQRRYPKLDVFGMNPGIVPTTLRDNSYGGNNTLLGRASEFLVRVFNPTADQYVERTVLPLMADKTLVGPACFSAKGRILPPAGWVAHETNRKWVWEVSDLMAKRATSAEVSNTT